MRIVSRPFVLLLAVVSGIVAIFPRGEVGVGKSFCGGQRYVLSAARNGASPYIELTAKGVPGQFLLDYGTTKSSLAESLFAHRNGPDDLSLPGYQGERIALEHYDWPFQPRGGQVGVIGTDLLAHLSAQFSNHEVFLGVEPCQSSLLRAAGFIPVSQSQFFSANPFRIAREVPNVPVLFIGLGEIHAPAQIDTGYDDTVYTHSVDINQALFAHLLRSGFPLQYLTDIRVSTCEGRENRSVYVVKNRFLVIETDAAAPIVRVEKFHLIVKPVNGCGGIATMPDPAAQLGASFLRLFTAVIFDPYSETVWVEGSGSSGRF
jgi:hypothetical protein